MNEYEIDDAVQRYASHPVLGNAARFLAMFKDEVNTHSDGWSYWKQPVRAAGKLMQLLRDHDPRGPRLFRPTLTDEVLRAALTPIRAFYTRHGYRAGMQLPAGWRREEGLKA